MKVTALNYNCIESLYFSGERITYFDWWKGNPSGKSKRFDLNKQITVHYTLDNNVYKVLLSCSGAALELL
jgi:hypothetical protein